jgi:hypothetical protein
MQDICQSFTCSVIQAFVLWSMETNAQYPYRTTIQDLIHKNLFTTAHTGLTVAIITSRLDELLKV